MPAVSDMPPEDFRRHAHEAADWIADYLQGVGSFPVLPSVESGDVRRTLPDTAPTEGEPFETLMEEFQSKILAGVTHWNHPAFFAYFPAPRLPRGRRQASRTSLTRSVIEPLASPKNINVCPM